MNIFMGIFSPQNTYFGRFQPREKASYTKKKIISPVLERENLPQKNYNVLNYNKQKILMPPVKKPLSLSLNKINTGRQKFLKDKTRPERERVVCAGQDRESSPNKEDPAGNDLHKNPTKSNRQQPLKERIKIYEIHLNRAQNSSSIDYWSRSNVDIISTVPLCRSTKYLQKYGCLHTDPVSNRWRVWNFEI